MGTTDLVRASDTVAVKLLDMQSDAVVWFKPVYGDEAVPVDFVVGYCNYTTATLLKAPKDQVIGERLSDSKLLDEVSRKTILEQCLEVWQSGNTIEFNYYSPGLDKHFNAQRSKVLDGVLSVTRDHTQVIRLKHEKEAQHNLLHQLLHHSPSGVCLYEAVRDRGGKILDFKMVLVNQKTAEITGVSNEDVAKYTAKELMVLRGQTAFFDVCCSVVETGVPVHTEMHLKPRNQWIAISIVKFGDGYLINYTDVTYLKQLEQRAQAQADLLQGVLDASFTGILALEAISGFSGKALDFKITMANKRCETMLDIKQEDKRKTLLNLFPTAKSNGFFDFLCKALDSAEPLKENRHYKGERLNGWYAVSANRLAVNALVVSFTETRPD